MREFSCNNQCKSDCCSDVFITLTDKQLKEFNQDGGFEAKKTITDMRWLGFHKGIKITKLSEAKVYIELDEKIEFSILNDAPIGYPMLYVKSKCKQLMQNKRCKVYRIRPKVCRMGKCPIFDNSDKMHKFIALNGLLKDVWLKHNEKKENNQM